MQSLLDSKWIQFCCLNIAFPCSLSIASSSISASKNEYRKRLQRQNNTGIEWSATTGMSESKWIEPTRKFNVKYWIFFFAHFLKCRVSMCIWLTLWMNWNGALTQWDAKKTDSKYSRYTWTHVCFEWNFMTMCAIVSEKCFIVKTTTNKYSHVKLLATFNSFVSFLFGFSLFFFFFILVIFRCCWLFLVVRRQ